MVIIRSYILFFSAAILFVTVNCPGCARGENTFEAEIVALASDDRTAVHAGAGAAPPEAGTVPDTGPITLADLLALAESRHPALAIARSEAGMAAALAWQQSLYPNPDFDVSAEEVPFGAADEGIMLVSVTQPIVLGDRLDNAEAAARAELAAGEASIEAHRRELFGEAAALHAQLIAIRHEAVLYDTLAQEIEATLAIARTRVEARAAPETDALRTEIELRRLQAARKRLVAEEAAALRRLSIMIGGVAIDAARLAGEIPTAPPALDLDGLVNPVRRNHPALIAVDREIDAAQARWDLVQAEETPDLHLRAGVGYSGERDDGIFELGAGMTIPMWDAREGDRLAARLDLMRSRQRRELIEVELVSDLAAAHGEYESSRAQMESVRDEILPAAMRSFDVTQEAYRAGRADFLELIDAQRTLIEAHIMVGELSSAAAQARARIMQVTGPIDGPDLPHSGSPSNRSSPTPSDAPHGAEVRQ